MAKKKKPEIVVANPNSRLITQIRNWQQQSQSNTSKWELQQLKWFKMRMRIKKVKNYPFVGCSNIRMPTIETKVRKLKAAMSNVIFGIRPVVQVIPTPSGTFDNAMKVEKFLDHMIMDVIKLKPKVIIAIDQMLEKGFYLMKPYWHYEEITREETLNIEDFSVQEVQQIHSSNTTKEMLIQALVDHLQVDMSDSVKDENTKELSRIAEEIHSGATSVSVKLQDIICNYPDADVCMPERIYVPTSAGYHPKDCDFIIHEFFLPLDTVKKNAEIKGWDVGIVGEVTAMKQINLNTKNIQWTKDYREGIMRLQQPDQMVRIWEVYCWYDLDSTDETQINPSGNKTKCVITFAPDFSKILRKSTLPFSNGQFPFVKFFYELTDDRWFSHRGIPEIIEDIVKEIDMQHMQKLDHQTITNTPMFLYRAGMVNSKVVQFVFGQGLPVNGMTPLQDVMQPMNTGNSNQEFSYKDEQMVLESKIEELTGQIDFTLQSMINKRQPRTLGEVQMQQQNSNTVFSLDASLLIGQIEELFNWVWDLWCQYGDDETEFAYFGKDGWEKIRLNREEVQGKYKITVRGNDMNTNPQVRLQKAQAILAGMENPMLAQMGVITPINVANAIKCVYQELDIPNWQELVTFPQPPQPPVPPPPPVKMTMQDLTPQEQAQVLTKFGIQPDVQGMALKHQEDLMAPAVEHEHSIIQQAMKNKHDKEMAGFKEMAALHGKQADNTHQADQAAQDRQNVRMLEQIRLQKAVASLNKGGPAEK